MAASSTALPMSTIEGPGSRTTKRFFSTPGSRDRMLPMRRKTFRWVVARAWPGWALARGKRDVEEGEVGYDEGGGGSGVQYA